MMLFAISDPLVPTTHPNTYVQYVQGNGGRREHKIISQIPSKSKGKSFHTNMDKVHQNELQLKWIHRVHKGRRQTHTHRLVCGGGWLGYGGQWMVVVLGSNQGEGICS